MSQENVERYRAMLEGFMEASRSSDWESWLATLPQGLDPEVEWDARGVGMPDLTGLYRGPEAVVEWWRRWLEAWEAVEFDEFHLLDAGDRVVLLVDQRMRGRATGIEVPVGKYAHVTTFKDGLIVHWRSYSSQARALAAAGLAPDVPQSSGID